MRRFVVLFVLFSCLAGTVPAAAQRGPVVLRAPVDAPVLDPYRPPASGFGAGNRGIEYDTDPAEPVVAAGPGLVIFAGPVAGVTWITIDHGDGLVTSYGPLDGLRVRVGDGVDRGMRIATTDGPLHFSTRIGGEYVDPATLLGVREVRVRLVDHANDDHARWLAQAERDERLQLLDVHRMGWRDAFAATLGMVGSLYPNPVIDLLEWRERIAELVHLGGVVWALAEGLDTNELVARLVVGIGFVLDPLPCTAAGVAAGVTRPIGRRRIALVVDGLDSSGSADGAMAALDLEGVGYDADDVVRFSYAGGLVPGGGDGWDVPRRDYDPSTTRGHIEDHISHLGDTLRAIAAANPGVEIDVYGHSLGGVVARHAIAATQDDVPIGVAMTFAAPHAGAPMAEFIEAVELTGPGAIASEIAEGAWDDMLLVAPVIEDLAESGFAGDTKDVPFPDDVHAVTIGARADVMVPATMADAPGARHVIVGGMDPWGAHGDITALPEVEQEVRLALAGMAPICSGTTDAVLDLIVPEAIAWGEHAAGAGVLIADTRPG